MGGWWGGVGLAGGCVERIGCPAVHCVHAALLSALRPAGPCPLSLRALPPNSFLPALPPFPSPPPLCSEHLRADAGAEYDEVIEINMSDLEPQINGPFTPDLANPLSQFADNARREGWPLEVSGEQAGVVGGGGAVERKKLGQQTCVMYDGCIGAQVIVITLCTEWPIYPHPLPSASAPPRPAPPACSRPDWLLHQLLVRGHDARRLGGQAGPGRGHQGQGALCHLSRLGADPRHHRPRRPDRDLREGALAGWLAGCA